MEAVTSAAAAEELLEAGNTAIEESRYGEAIELFTAAIDSGLLPDEQIVPAYNGRARARQLNIYVTATGIDDEMDRAAILLLQDAAYGRALAPESPDYPLLEGEAFLMLGAYEEARRAFEDAAIVEAPITAWAWIRLASLYRTLGDHGMALQYVNLMLQRWTDDVGMPPHYHKARILYDAGRHAEAVESLTDGLVHQPDYSWALVYRGCSYAHLGQFAEALADYDAALGLREEEMANQTQSEKQRLDHARLTLERQALAAYSEGNEAEIPVAELCAVDTVGDSRRERSALLTDEILGPINETDSMAREIAAAAVPEYDDPELAAMCAMVTCREVVRANRLELPDGGFTFVPNRKLPYVDPDGAVLIYPGETIVVAIPIDGDAAGQPRLQSVTDRD
jgi:tetratricopeptide (TPR) repeat protein